MRNTITTILLVAATGVSGIVNAQAHHGHKGFVANMRKSAHRSPMAMQPKFAAKTTATEIRLKSVAELQHDGTAFLLTDSVNLTYTGTNAGYFDDRWLTWTWKFDQGLVYPFTAGSYGPAETKLSQTFDTHNRVDTQSYLDWNSTTSVWENSGRTIYTWDALDRMTSELAQSWSTTLSSWENNYRSSYTYTGTTDKIAGIVEENWDNTTSAWENSTKTTNTHDVAGNLTQENVEYWNSSTTAWETGGRSSFVYDLSGNRLAELSESWTGSAWDTSGLILSSGFVADHQPQMVKYLNWNSITATFDSSFLEGTSYNTNGKPVYSYSQDWNAVTAAWEYNNTSYASRMHYETFSTGSTGVEKIADAGGTAVIFPVPAVNELTIDATWNDAQPFTVSVTDLSGKLFTTWTVQAKKQYRETFSVSALPAGNYIMLLQGTKGSVAKQFSVVK